MFRCSFWICLDVHSELAQYLPQITYSCDFIQSIPSSNSTIILPNWTCNNYNYTTFDFSRFTNVESIEIGDNSFGFVSTFKIDGLNKLNTLKIGNYSFTRIKNEFYSSSYNIYYSFHILNCEELKSIDIGIWSFSDFGGEFELKNLPQLQSINIGTIGDYDSFDSSNNFYYSSFIIRGILIHSYTHFYRYAQSINYHIRW